jgi:NADPH-dependent 2,4-dienoyl-CoA reductase/sulfur reductase-like enzyme/rhodanese-related sulfurtransferase
MKTNKIIIIGGVAGGATAAAKIRREDENAEITIIERGQYVSFANCGLPYFIGRDIKDRSALLLQTPQGFWDRYKIKVLVNSVATLIDRENKVVHYFLDNVKNTLSYDKLIISQGATPLIPPVAGGNASHVFSLRDMSDMDRIDDYISVNKVKSAIVVGGGFIGIEMAEALIHRGLNVTLVEKAPQVMALMDTEYGVMIESELRHHKIGIHLNNSITSINADTKTSTLEDGTVVDSEMVLFSIGVRPELSLAKECGLELGQSGGLVVNDELQTSDASIYAVGDMIEIHHRIMNKQVRVPLAGPANRQGRIAGINAIGVRKEKYKGAIGSSVVKIFNNTAALTGLSERLAKNAGLNATSITVHPKNHAGYYPGSKQLSLTLVFDKTSGKILGAESYGEQGIEKRIDVLATAIHGEMTVYDLEELDLCYAPPYSSANDPVNMAGFVAANSISGYSSTITAEEFLKKLKSNPNLVVVDVRNSSECEVRKLKNSINIPVNTIRNQLDKLNKDDEIYLHCAVGFRAHLAIRILMQNGFTKVFNISGGFKSIETLMRDEKL